MLPTEFFPERPLLPWQQNSGQNGLKLGLHKKYRRYLRQMGVFELQTANCKLQTPTIWYGHCAIIRKRAYAPAQKSYVKCMKNRDYLTTKAFLHFLTLL